MTYIGITPLGERVLLPPASYIKIVKNEDAPADGFTGVFPLFNDIGHITSIRIYNKNHKLNFDGIVDEQKKSRSKNAELSINARSRAAVLLDNEAIPQTYISPSLRTVFTRHVKPYGFTDFLGDSRSFNGELTVTKGMSEWQAAEKFCTDFLKVKPRILEDKFDASGKRPKEKLIFDNFGGISYSSVSFEDKYYSLISEISGKAEGSTLYTSIAKNNRAFELGIKRRRCINRENKNPNDLIRKSQKKASCAVVECPGEVTAELFAEAQIKDTQFGNLDKLYVSQIEYKLSTNGEISRFILRRWE